MREMTAGPAHPPPRPRARFPSHRGPPAAGAVRVWESRRDRHDDRRPDGRDDRPTPSSPACRGSRPTPGSPSAGSGCPDTRADLAAEAVALAWKHFAALLGPGEEAGAVRHGPGGAVHPGGPGRPPAGPGREGHRRAVAGRAGPARGRGDGQSTTATGSAGRWPRRWRGTPGRGCPEQVAFRVDFPRWRAGLGPRNRAVLDALAGGDGTYAVAARFGLSPARVSQLRREFERSWRAYTRA